MPGPISAQNLELALSTLSIFKILLPSVAAFFFGIFFTPFITDFLYKHKLWKKKNISTTIDGQQAIITASILGDGKRQTPRMGGLVIICSVIFSAVFFYLLSVSFDFNIFSKLNFISRNQT